MRKFVVLLLACAIAINAQQAGHQNPDGDNHKDWTIQDCSAPGQCSSVTGKITLDANWRWLHHVDDYVNCYTGNQWETQYCPDNDQCAQNCALENVGGSEWSSPYGITLTSTSISMKFVTVGPYSTNIGSRVFLMSDDDNYMMFQLKNREFTFTVDDNSLPCGLNGALYFVSMDANGGLGVGNNNAGAAFGTGYCDAQCPHDIKFVGGEANVQGWTPADNDANSGKGNLGACCSEMDIWEANSQSQAFTTHPCLGATRYTVCKSDEGTACGDNDSGDRYNGICDKDGCDFASYRLGDTEFWGAGKTVDASQAVTVVTQFITDDGTDNGNLQEVRRLYIQNGQEIENSVVAIGDSTVDGLDSITTEFCEGYKVAFGDIDDHKENGGLQQMGAGMDEGMVLVMSLWDDHDACMLWLDGNYPNPTECGGNDSSADPSTPGIARGPCADDSGDPADVEQQNPDASVTFSDVRIGAIGSTYADLLY